MQLTIENKIFRNERCIFHCIIHESYKIFREKRRKKLTLTQMWQLGPMFADWTQ